MMRKSLTCRRRLGEKQLMEGEGGDGRRREWCVNLEIPLMEHKNEGSQNQMTGLNKSGHQVLFKEGGGGDGDPREWKVLAQDL